MAVSKPPILRNGCKITANIVVKGVKNIETGRTIGMITSLYWERFYIRPARYQEYRDIDHRFIHRYTGNIVISRIVMSRFHCVPKLYQPGSCGIN